MIPKIIHYCWFGRSEKSQFVKKCIDSWKRYCPDFEIIEWNEDNFDLDYNDYVRYCYNNRKWAFLSDFVRLAVVAERGGLYFDTDVELVKSPEEVLQYEAFYGFENDEYVNSGQGFGAVSGHSTVIRMRDEYASLTPDENGDYPLIGCPRINTQILADMGLKRDGTRQNVAGAEIFPEDYFNPYDDPTGRLNKTQNTISIHWYAKSWMSKKVILRSKITKPLHRLFGVDVLKRLRRK